MKKSSFFLFNDILVATKANAKTSRLSLSSTKSSPGKSGSRLSNSWEEDLETCGLTFKYIETIQLHGGNIIDITTNPKIPTFRLETNTKNYTFFTDSTEDFYQWMNEIEEQISRTYEADVSRTVVESHVGEEKIDFSSNSAKEGMLMLQEENGEWKQVFISVKQEHVGIFDSLKQMKDKTSNPLKIHINSHCIIKRMLSDLPFCFQVITNKRIFFFAAESNKELFEWMYDFRSIILNKYKENLKKSQEEETAPPVSTPSSSNLKSPVEVIKMVKSRPDNSTCADCGSPNPVWADVSLEVIICLQCSGIHRRLGTKSNVKSMTFGKWQNSLLEKFSKISNKTSNEFWENNDLLNFLQRPKEHDSYAIKSNWIEAKYRKPKKDDTVHEVQKGTLKRVKAKSAGTLKFIDDLNNPISYYCKIDGKNLLYFKDSQDAKPVGSVDLKLASVLIDNKKPCQFDVKTQTRILTFKTEDESDMNSWIKGITNAIN